MTRNRHRGIQLVHRAQLRDNLHQRDEQTLDARVDRYLEINHQDIIANHYFAQASSECIDLYRDGHFIAVVMATQAVNEGILKLLAERNSIKYKTHEELMDTLREQAIISPNCATAAENIWGSFRNDVHHMNPKVGRIKFPELAKQNLQNLAIVEREVFGTEDGTLIPKQPKYWDVQEDGTVPAFLRYGI